MGWTFQHGQIALDFSTVFFEESCNTCPRQMLSRGPCVATSAACAVAAVQRLHSQRPSKPSPASPTFPVPPEEANFELFPVSVSLLEQSVWLKGTQRDPEATAGMRSSHGVHRGSLVPIGPSARAEASPGWRALHGAGGTGAVSVCRCKVTTEPYFWTYWLSQEERLQSQAEYRASCERLFSETRVLLTSSKKVNKTSLWRSGKISYVRYVGDFLTGRTMTLRTKGQRNAEGSPSFKAFTNNLTNIFASGLDILNAFHQRIRLHDLLRSLTR